MRTVHGIKYGTGDFVFVHNKRTASQNTAKTKSLNWRDYWVAKILEIRASGPFHVYVRVYWMYSWTDLPLKTQAKPDIYFENELVASNHSKRSFCQKKCAHR